MSNSVIERLKIYCEKNPQLVSNKIIKGINSNNGNIVIEKDGVSKEVSIDVLEQGLFDFDSFEIKNINNNIYNLDNLVMEEPVEEIEELNDSIPEPKTLDNIPTNLNEMQNCVLSKNEKLIDKALETFAIDEKTGMININKAIKIITDNSVNNVAFCVKNKKDLPKDLSSYDLTGKLISNNQDSTDNIDIQQLIDISFSNILVYVEVAKLKNVSFTENQINNAKKKYTTSVNDKLNVLGLNQNNGENETHENVVSDIKPNKDVRKAGFADILILTIIILIYAAIIVNLIIKLR